MNCYFASSDTNLLSVSDIYKLSGGRREASYPPSPPLSLPDTDHTGKWVCAACTFYNYPRASACTICRTPTSSLVSSVSKLSTSGSPGIF